MSLKLRLLISQLITSSMVAWSFAISWFLGVDLHSSSFFIVGTVAVGVSVAVGYLLSIRDATKISEPIHDLVQRAKKLKVASEGIATESTQLSDSASEQAASLQETVTCVDEISAMVQKNTEAANQSAETSQSTKKIAAEGSKTVKDMVRAIENISESNENITEEMMESHKKINEITDVISEIGEKTRVINDIVFQTKLLSFNASVEAARAGEHGKGFAVVAEEVGNLAAMSGSASKEISELLSGSLDKVERIVKETQANIDRLVEVGKEKVESGKNQARACEENFSMIMNDIEKLDDWAGGIANASREQSTGIQEVTKAMSRLDSVTQTNSHISQASKKSASSVSEETENMTEVLENLQAWLEGKKKLSSNESFAGTTTKAGDNSHKVSSSKVVEMKDFRKSNESAAPKKQATAAKTQSAPQAAPVQVAASGNEFNDSEFPDADDPRFEDF